MTDYTREELLEMFCGASQGNTIYRKTLVALHKEKFPERHTEPTDTFDLYNQYLWLTPYQRPSV